MNYTKTTKDNKDKSFLLFVEPSLFNKIMAN